MLPMPEQTQLSPQYADDGIALLDFDIECQLLLTKFFCLISDERAQGGDLFFAVGGCYFHNKKLADLHQKRQ